MAMIKLCLHCGEPCTSRRRTFCSQACHGHHRKATTKKRACATCGKPTKKISRKFCSSKCNATNPETRERLRKLHLGRKQTPECIAKRIANTNQEAKEAARKATCVSRFGVDNYGKTEQHRHRVSGPQYFMQPTKTACHLKKIIESKRRNGTLNHSEQTKRKIRKSVALAFSDPKFDRSVFVSKVFTHFAGYYRGLYYRSSYELLFLKFCNRYCLQVEAAGTKEYAVPYKDVSGVRRMYYPDFYLPEFNLVIEIKPESMLSFGANPMKFAAARKHHARFCVLTELSGYTDKKRWHDLYYGTVMGWCSEYLCN